MEPMKAYHNDPALKREYLARVMAHARADEIVHGQYWEGGKGCAVGCTIHGSEHARYETVLGIPQALAKLEDTIFEGLQNGEAKKFPAAFLRSIKPGADLSLVQPRFLLALQRRNLKRLKASKVRDVACEKAVEQVIAVLLDWVKTGKANESAARSAWSSAKSSESAAWSAAKAAESARSAEYSWMAKTLLKLLREAA